MQNISTREGRAAVQKMIGSTSHNAVKTSDSGADAVPVQIGVGESCECLVEVEHSEAFSYRSQQTKRREGKSTVYRSFLRLKRVFHYGSYRIALVAVLFAALLGFSSLSSASTAHAASNAAMQKTGAHVVSQILIPQSGGGFSVSTTGAKVTGTINFTSKTTFTLTNVYLYDTKCDASSAYFYVDDDNGAFQTHQNGNGCGTYVHYSSLSGSDSHGGLIWLQVVVYDNCCSNASGLYSNPYA